MRARWWFVAGALALLATGVAAQDGDFGLQTFTEVPSTSFGDDAELGKYNYLGRAWVPSDLQMPGEGSPITLDSETVKKLHLCLNGVCPQNGSPASAQAQVAVAPELAPRVAVAEDEVRLDNPQAVELGLRLTVAGVPSVVNIKPAGTHTQKLAGGVAAVAEIASGSTVTTTSLLPGKAYSIQVVSGAYFIVPVN